MWVRSIVEWIDSRVGLTETVLRPGPDYSLNLFYWLGALMVVAFIVQGITGLMMLLYYVPTVQQAYSSTLFIIQEVPLGRLLETVHLYSAYAMVVLAVAHLMRGYFASVHKRPREVMWVVGMFMGIIVLIFGLTICHGRNNRHVGIPSRSTCCQLEISHCGTWQRCG
jgi:cytochrome b-561